MTNTNFIGKFFTSFKFKTGFVSVIYTCYAVSMTLGFSNFAGLPHRTGFAFLDAETVVVVGVAVCRIPFLNAHSLITCGTLHHVGIFAIAGSLQNARLSSLT